MNIQFFPDHKVASRLDSDMRKSLAESLSYILDSVDGVLDYDKVKYQSIITQLHNEERYSALIFGLYTKLVISITNEDYALSEKILDTIPDLTSISRAGNPQTVNMDDQSFLGHSSLLSEIMDLEEGTSFLIQAAAPNAAECFAERLERAFQLMDAHIPELKQEIETLVTQIIMVEPVPGSNLVFDGGSCPMLWGGLFLNAYSHESALALVEVLAHESAHLLLFGYAANEALTLNAEDERFTSPLREEARPMEGVFHATFVTARMYWAMDSLAKSMSLDDKEKEYIETALARNLTAYFDGYKVVKQQAKLSSIGEELLEASFSYMEPELRRNHLLS